MSMPGQYNFRGLDAQTQASVLFFLTYVKDPDFDSVVLEDKDWEDFTLYFKSGRKIICESKNHTAKLGWSAVKSILSKINARTAEFSKTDRILIICNEAMEELVQASDRLKYGITELRAEYKRHRFTEAEIDLLAKTDFYIIPRDDLGESLMYRRAQEFLYAYLNFWIPDSELNRLFDSLYQKFFRGSSTGLKISRLEIFDEIEAFKKERIKLSGGGIYDVDARELESQLDDIIGGIESPSARHNVRGDNLSAITAQPKLMFYLITRLEQSKELELRQWEFLWEAMLVGFYAFRMQMIFEKNFETSVDNGRFILEFVAKNYGRISFKAAVDSYSEYFVEICSKVLKQAPQLKVEALDLIKKVLELRKGEYRDYDLTRENEREKEAVAGLIFELNHINLAANNVPESLDLLKLVAKHFSLIEDDGEYEHYSPKKIFDAYEEYLSADFLGNFESYTQLIIQQYDESKFYPKGFKGREYMGSGVSSSAGTHSIRDKHFLEYSLTPALEKYYAQDGPRAFKLIKDRFLTLKSEDISHDRPDFLNRCSIGLLIDEYAKDISSIEGEEYELIVDLMSVAGITDKRELIFQNVRNQNMSPSKKWALVKASLQKTNGLPVNIFVEEIARSQAETNDEAATYLAKWSVDPATHEHRLFGRTAPSENIRSLLANEKTFSRGVAALNEYLMGDDFRHSTDSFHASDTAPLITEILIKSFDKGLAILESIYGHDVLSINDQWILSSTLRNLPDDDTKLGLACYESFLRPHLEELGSISEVERKLSNRHAREELIWFSEKLAKQLHFAEALWLVELFVNDSNPRLLNEDDDPDGTFNYHQKVIEGDMHITINTVRGCIPWVLQKFINVHARPYLHRVIELMSRLCRDENYYVRTMALIPLSDFARVRHSVMDDAGKDYFMEVDDAIAIKGIAFDAIRNPVNQELRPLMGNLVHVFGNMRSLSQAEALEVLGYLKPMTDEDVDGDSALLFIFYAEYRKDAFKKFRREELGPFDDKPFKKILVNQIKFGPDAMRRSLAWHFYKLPKERKSGSIEQTKAFRLACKYFSYFTHSYGHSSFEYIYMFLDDNFDSQYDECFKLWKKCVTVERKFLENEAKINPDGLRDKGWWVHWRNKDTLRHILDHEGQTVFLYWFNFLLDYPSELPIFSDYFDLARTMAAFDDENLIPRVNDTFNKLIEVNPNFLDIKKDWIEKRAG